MAIFTLILALLAGLGSIPDARAQDVPAALGPNARSQYVERFLQAGFHRAFATSPDGRFAWVAHRPSVESAIADALAACNRDRPGCRIRAVNGLAVDGASPEAIARRDPDAPALATLVPGDYARIAGPATAPGLVIWSHGYRPGVDSSTSLAHAYVMRFMASGWDVYRYDRARIESRDADLAGLLRGIEAARQAGYRRVVLAGQSRGGWISLQAAAAGVAIDGVVATAPATHGNNPNSPAMARARAEFRSLIERVAQHLDGRRVVISLFDGDDFEPGGRREDVAAILGAREGVLFIDHPPDLRGHGAGANPAFNARYGACLLVFIVEATRDPSCPAPRTATR